MKSWCPKGQLINDDGYVQSQIPSRPNKQYVRGAHVPKAETRFLLIPGSYHYYYLLRTHSMVSCICPRSYFDKHFHERLTSLIASLSLFSFSTKKKKRQKSEIFIPFAPTFFLKFWCCFCCFLLSHGDEPCCNQCNRVTRLVIFFFLYETLFHI